MIMDVKQTDEIAGTKLLDMKLHDTKMQDVKM